MVTVAPHPSRHVLDIERLKRKYVFRVIGFYAVQSKLVTFFGGFSSRFRNDTRLADAANLFDLSNSVLIFRYGTGF
ncbi:uncharacterized protein EAF02_003819 [Botrytis sinoallii]|uniref:uncharacterized protein n=1 Tax=Botrytis sinoallii TaxID=1463999 RepID=UPI0018FF83B6|nr:uncharacterized protein EAF02_003819 [Botrytis sinoallii]KAF7887172.1 hypothetical protein EAF02_003819 [Botrytis sinoallii]